MERPTSITVFGILNICLGSLGILGFLGYHLLLAVLGEKNNPFLVMFAKYEHFVLYNRIAMTAGFVASIVLLVSGIGLMKLRRWGRTAGFIYAGYLILISVVHPFATFFLLLSPMSEQKRGVRDPEQLGAAIGGFLSPCFWIVFAVLLLIYLNRRVARVAFGLEKDMYDTPDRGEDLPEYPSAPDSGNPYESPDMR